MKYRVLRTCFVADHLWHEGEIYELPDDMHKAEKNFVPLDGKPIAEVKAEVKGAVTHDTEAKVGFICPTCSKVCKNKIGLSGHMKSHKK